MASYNSEKTCNGGATGGLMNCSNEHNLLALRLQTPGFSSSMFLASTLSGGSYTDHAISGPNPPHRMAHTKRGAPEPYSVTPMAVASGRPYIMDTWRRAHAPLV